jgi:multidrug efflux pump
MAAAEGIDYIESQSTQGLSTINVRLKLNFDQTAALADISARVAQMRADLPPEAQVPSIAVEPSEAAFAAMYLSFGSTILEENQVTDYLIRIIQPRLSALAGVQKADILGGRTFAMRVWLMPDRMAALNVSPSVVRQALAANNYAAAVGQTKGNLTQLDISATTDISSVEEVEQLVLREHQGTLVRLKDIAKVELGAEEYDLDVRFNGKRAVFMGVWVAPTSSS